VSRPRPPAPGDRPPDPAVLEALRAKLVETTQPRPTRRRGRRGLARLEESGPFDDDMSPEPPDDPETGPWWRREDAGKPIPVDGGIAATTRRGQIGSTWWSRRFLGALEAVMVGGRMDRGRSYARKGQVVQLALGAGTIEATVQGSRQEPYRVRLTMAVVPDGDWDRIVAALGAQAGYAARMLAGDLPHEVEDVFSAEGASLFPGPHARPVTECTCPDFENPCKHIAAVCFLVAEGFDRDPFGLLAWRGRDRETVLRALRVLRGAGTGDLPPAPPSPPPEETEVSLAGSLDHFWTPGPALAGVHVHPVAVEVPTAVLRQLPAGVLTVGGRDVSEVLAPAYTAITAGALAQALGEPAAPGRLRRRPPA
jgi:uncharacterized Zn finger protein